MDEKCTTNSINGTDHAFGFPVLRRSVGTGEPKKDDVSRENFFVGSIFKFTAVVTLKRPSNCV